MGNGASDVERYRGLVSVYFAAENVERVMCLMRAESGGNPNALSSKGARGLMQIMPGWASSLGLSRDSLYDPDTNIRVATVVLQQQGWTAWSPYKRGACR